MTGVVLFPPSWRVTPIVWYCRRWGYAGDSRVFPVVWFHSSTKRTVERIVDAQPSSSRHWLSRHGCEFARDDSQDRSVCLGERTLPDGSMYRARWSLGSRWTDLDLEDGCSYSKRDPFAAVIVTGGPLHGSSPVCPCPLGYDDELVVWSCLGPMCGS